MRRNFSAIDGRIDALKVNCPVRKEFIEKKKAESRPSSTLRRREERRPSHITRPSSLRNEITCFDDSIALETDKSYSFQYCLFNVCMNAQADNGHASEGQATDSASNIASSRHRTMPIMKRRETSPEGVTSDDGFGELIPSRKYVNTKYLYHYLNDESKRPSRGRLCSQRCSTTVGLSRNKMKFSMTPWPIE